MIAFYDIAAWSVNREADAHTRRLLPLGAGDILGVLDGLRPWNAMAATLADLLEKTEAYLPTWSTVAP